MGRSCDPALRQIAQQLSSPNRSSTPSTTPTNISIPLQPSVGIANPLLSLFLKSHHFHIDPYFPRFPNLPSPGGATHDFVPQPPPVLSAVPTLPMVAHSPLCQPLCPQSSLLSHYALWQIQGPGRPGSRSCLAFTLGGWAAPEAVCLSFPRNFEEFECTPAGLVA